MPIILFSMSHFHGAGVAQSVWLLGYRLDGPVLEFRQWQETILFCKTSRPDVVANQPPTRCVQGFFTGSKEAGA
jgi:hypothetical protein